MKYKTYILLITLSILAIQCQTKNKDSTNSTASMSIDTIYHVDTLKNDYYLKAKGNTANNFYLLEKAHKIPCMFGEYDRRMSIEAIGFLLADFGNSVVIAHKGGGGFLSISIYDKQTCKLLAEGVKPFYFEKDTVLFESDDNYFVLYSDVSKSKKYAPIPAENTCLCCNCWSVERIDNNIAFIIMNSESKKFKTEFK
jgi:hypothetical protein